MLNSKQLMEVTGISRATLNNYVAQGILPNPVIRTPSGESGRATRLGYFDETAADIVNQVQQLKKDGLSMAQIADLIGTRSALANEQDAAQNDAGTEESIAQSGTPRLHPASSASHSPPRSTSSAQRSAPTNLNFAESIENFPGPAYMVNNNFELIWWNDKASSSFFQCQDNLPGDLESRNLLKMLFTTLSAQDPDTMRDMLKPHLAVGKKRLSQQALVKIYSALDAEQLSILKDLYEEVEPIGKEPMVHFPAILPVREGGNRDESMYDLYACFYREGILFTFSPVQLENDFLLEFLSKRNHVINELLKKREPYLTNVTVMVADVQNSIRICSELPAEEYFELINNIWQESESIFRKYYGTYGKHAGDGMVYYFFPQPDCDYKLNAIRCSLELQQMMRRITLKWQSRKGWFSDLHLNIGLNEGQEWFGSFHAGGHVEFTVLGETINYASRISDFARNGSIWATKNMLNQIPSATRQKIKFGIARQTQQQEPMFVNDTYASLGSLLDGERASEGKFMDLGMLPITEIRGVED
ncbi:MAG: adenylate/guanylate cyclase domain-containing protein [Gammaproteobacteria bacterium]